VCRALPGAARGRKRRSAGYSHAQRFPSPFNSACKRITGAAVAGQSVLIQSCSPPPFAPSAAVLPRSVGLRLDQVLRQPDHPLELIIADSDEDSRRFRLKPATCSDGSQPVIPTKPAGVAERTASGMNGVSLPSPRQVCRSSRHAAFAVTRPSVRDDGHCGPNGRARRQRWWDRRCEHANCRLAVGW
jgi:hypothetical protein